MANIAQVANVLQSMILTDTIGSGHMVLTPTYHVFRLYQGFQDAMALPVGVTAPEYAVEGGHMQNAENVNMQALSVSAARKPDGNIVVSLVNTRLDKPLLTSVDVTGCSVRNVEGEILSSGDVRDYNDFVNPDKVCVAKHEGIKIKKGTVTLEVPPLSVVVLDVECQ